MFKNNFSFDSRKKESEKILRKFPNKIPVIVERSTFCKLSPEIDKNKYLVDNNFIVGQFLYYIRSRMKMDSSQSLFLFINNSLPLNLNLLLTEYHNNKDSDGFLYIYYASESTFG